jgi:phage gp36-like protein
MAYCTSAQVVADFKTLTVGATGPVNTTNIADFIAQADAEINSYLAVKYTTPITGTEALLMCQMLSIYLVKSRIQSILRVKTGKEDPDQDTSDNLRGVAIKTLERLAKGTMILTDATLATSADGVKSRSNTDGVENHFDLSSPQW